MTMMKKIFYGLFLTLFLTNCASERKTDVERVNTVECSVITDSIFSSMPGSIFAMDGYVYWEDAMGTENFIHVVDVKSGNEVCSFGNVGDGPDEFAYSLASVSPSGNFFLNDPVKGMEHLYTIDGSGSYSMKTDRYGKNTSITNLVHLDDETVVNLTPGAESLFCINSGEKTETGGKFPFTEKYENAYYLYQGKLAYNPEHNLLVYSCMGLPYISTYSWKNEKLSLANEIIGEIEGSSQNGKFIIDKDDPVGGAMELALTRNYIVTLDRDVEVEGEKPESKSLRDFSTLPHSLYVYDYDLNLLKIINTEYCILRICGDTRTDEIYAIVVDPEFSLMKINISSLNKH